MSRWLIGVLASLAVSVSASAHGAGCPPDYAKGRPGDTLRVGYAESPPFVIASPDGQPRGAAIDALREVAADAGWRLELVALGPESLRDRVRACAVDVGVSGLPSSAALEAAVDVSQPFLVDEVTVAMLGQAEWVPRRGILATLARGLLGGAAALVTLAVAIGCLNARGIRRRVDGAVAGPATALRWLWRCPGGRWIAALWLGAGVIAGASIGRDHHGAVDLTDPDVALVRAAAATEDLVGLSVPDGDLVTCDARDGRACVRRLREGTLAAIAGSRAALCRHARDAALDGLVLRHDLATARPYGFLLPPRSPLAEAINRALTRGHAVPRLDACGGET